MEILAAPLKTDTTANNHHTSSRSSLEHPVY